MRLRTPALFLSMLIGISVMLGTLMPSLILIRFQIHRAEIVRTLCVQRSRPVEQNTCQGRCHLKKQLAESKRSGGGPQVPPRFNTAEWQGVMPMAASLPLPIALPLRFAGLQEQMLPGHPDEREPVPWA